LYRKLANLQELFWDSFDFFYEKILLYKKIRDWYNVALENKEWNMHMNKGHIFLIGFMGAGKSTVSACLHTKYGMNQMEMDEQIEKEEGMSVSRIFELYGEEYFRSRETELLRRLKDEERLVVSCGGGTAMRECNVQEMKQQGKIVWLSASPRTVYQRVKDTHNRPLLEGHMNEEYIGELMAARTPKYQAAADVVVHTDGRTAEDICSEIIDKTQS
jgi:shikimate kinase